MMHRARGTSFAVRCLRVRRAEILLTFVPTSFIVFVMLVGDIYVRTEKHFRIRHRTLSDPLFGNRTM